MAPLAPPPPFYLLPQTSEHGAPPAAGLAHDVPADSRAHRLGLWVLRGADEAGTELEGQLDAEVLPRDLVRVRVRVRVGLGLGSG